MDKQRLTRCKSARTTSRSTERNARSFCRFLRSRHSAALSRALRSASRFETKRRHFAHRSRSSVNWSEPSLRSPAKLRSSGGGGLDHRSTRRCANTFLKCRSRKCTGQSNSPVLVSTHASARSTGRAHTAQVPSAERISLALEGQSIFVRRSPRRARARRRGGTREARGLTGSRSPRCGCELAVNTRTRPPKYECSQYEYY